MLSLRKKFIADTAFYIIAQLLVRLQGFFILPIFAQMVGVEGYGVYTQITISIGLLLPFVSFRLETAAVRFLAGEENPLRLRNRFYTLLLFVTLISVAVSILLNAAADIGALLLLGDSAYTDLVALSSLLLVISVLTDNLRNYYRIIQRIKIVSIISIIQAGAELLAILIAVHQGYGVKGAIWASIGVQAVVSFVLLIAISTQLRGFGIDIQGLREMLAYSMPLMPNGLMNWVVNYADRIVIVQFLGHVALGAYSASYTFGAIINFLIVPVNFVLFPFLTRLWNANEKEEVRRYFVYVTRYYLLLALPVCVVVAMVSQRLLHYFASDDFETSRLLVFWITLGFVFNGLFQINVYAFHLVYKTRYVLFILLFGSLANALLNILLVPIIGLDGAAFATAVTFLFMGFIATIYGQRFIGYQINYMAVMKNIFATAVMSLGIYWMPVDSNIGILYISAVGAAIYFATLLAVHAFPMAEITYFRRVVASYIT